MIAALLHLHITRHDIGCRGPESPLLVAARRLFGPGWRVTCADTGISAERPPHPSLEDGPVRLGAEYPPGLRRWLERRLAGHPVEPGIFQLRVRRCRDTEIQPARQA